MLRERAIPFLAPFARHVSVHRLWRWAGRPLVAVFWHAPGPPAELPHIRHLYTPVSPARWRADLEWIVRRFEPLPFEEICAVARQQRPLRRPACFLSFDDGLRQVYECAWPELRRAGIPFAVFLNSAFIDNANLFFRYKASLLVEHWHQVPPRPAVRRAIEAILPNAALPQALLQIGFRQKAILDRVAQLLEVDFDAFLRRYRPYLTLSQIDAMARQGVVFGGHSHDHPPYAALDPDARLEQTRRSMAWIGRHLPQQPWRPFAFPFTDAGVSASFFARARAQGLFDCSFGTAGFRCERVRGHLQRHPMEKWPLAAAQQLPAALAWQALLRLCGRACIRR